MILKVYVPLMETKRETLHQQNVVFVAAEKMIVGVTCMNIWITPALYGTSCYVCHSFYYIKITLNIHYINRDYIMMYPSGSRKMISRSNTQIDLVLQVGTI